MIPRLLASFLLRLSITMGALISPLAPTLSWADATPSPSVEAAVQAEPVVLLVKDQSKGGDQEESGAPTTELRVSEAIAIAVQSNLGIRASSLTPREAQLGVMGAKGIYDPTLSANGTQAQLVEPCSNNLECPDGAPLIFTSALSMGLGLSQLTPLGGTVSLSASTVKRISSSAIFTFPGWITGAEVSVNQPLLRGGGYRINRLDIERSLLEQDLSWEVLRGQVQDLIVNVHVAYWELLSARESLELGKQSLEFAEKQAEITRERIGLGLDAPVEIYVVEQTVASRRADVQLSKNRVRTAEVNLRALMAWPIVGEGADIVIIPIDAPPALEVDLERVAIFDEAVRQDPTIQRLMRQVDIRELELLRARNGLLPSLNFQGSFGVNGSLGGEVDSPTGDNLSQVWTAGLSLSTDLGWRQARAAFGQADINRTQAELAILEREQSLALSVEQAINSVNTAMVRVDLNAKARELADKTLEAERERLARGESTLKNVLDYLTIRDQSRLTELGSRIELANAILTVEALRGTLVPQFDIDLEEVGRANSP